MDSLLAQADTLYSYEQSVAAIEVLSDVLNKHFENFSGEKIVALTLLNGGIVFAGMLLPKLSFALQLDSVGVSRYREHETGRDLRWHSKPRASLVGASVLLLDDIFDQGITLEEVKAWCVDQGANSVESVVLAWKQLEESEGKACKAKPDFYALSIPDKFVVGMGMDFAGNYRNAPGIFVLKK
jgi:Hypoxanthine-guanine phosphoribosyltransferase